MYLPLWPLLIRRKTSTNQTATECRRPNILPLRLARPCPPSPLRNVRDPNLVLSGNRNRAHGAWAIRLRSPQFPVEAAD